MVAIALIAVFLLVSWIFLALNNLSEYESTSLILCISAGLTAVVIVASTMIMSKLNSIHKLLEESKNKEDKEKSPEKEEN